MSAIDAGIRNVKRYIPMPILEAAFISPDQRMFGHATSVENEIYQKVIGPIVVPELSQFGQLREIDLTSLPYEEIQNNVRIYRIPEEATDFRPIVSAHIAGTNIVEGRYNTPPQSHYYQATSSSVINNANRITRSESPLPRVTTSEVRVLSDYTVQIREPYQFRTHMILHCRVRLSETLNEIKPPFYPVVSKLIRYAVQQYIYTKLVLEMGMTRLQHGKDFGEFKDIVNNYSDSGELFDDHIPLCSRILSYNDDVGNSIMRRHGGRLRS